MAVAVAAAAAAAAVDGCFRLTVVVVVEYMMHWANISGPSVCGGSPSWRNFLACFAPFKCKRICISDVTFISQISQYFDSSANDSFDIVGIGGIIVGIAIESDGDKYRSLPGGASSSSSNGGGGGDKFKMESGTSIVSDCIMDCDCDIFSASADSFCDDFCFRNESPIEKRLFGSSSGIWDLKE